jgi:hypothetical protein
VQSFKIGFALSILLLSLFAGCKKGGPMGGGGDGPMGGRPCPRCQGKGILNEDQQAELLDQNGDGIVDVNDGAGDINQDGIVDDQDRIFDVDGNGIINDVDRQSNLNSANFNINPDSSGLTTPSNSLSGIPQQPLGNSLQSFQGIGSQGQQTAPQTNSDFFDVPSVDTSQQRIPSAEPALQDSSSLAVHQE